MVASNPGHHILPGHMASATSSTKTWRSRRTRKENLNTSHNDTQRVRVFQATPYIVSKGVVAKPYTHHCMIVCHLWFAVYLNDWMNWIIDRSLLVAVSIILVRYTCGPGPNIPPSPSRLTNQGHLSLPPSTVMRQGEFVMHLIWLELTLYVLLLDSKYVELV